MTIVPAGEVPVRAGTVTWLTDDELATRINNLPSFPLGRDDTVRSRASLAGAQRKMVAVVDGAKVGIPDGAPSTHLLKPQWQPGPDDPQLHDLVANEAFCMRLAKHAGLDVADVEVRTIGSRQVLFVTRFDRMDDNGAVARLHQEDAAQAGGKLPSSKYQEDGGLSLSDVSATLDRAGIGRRDVGVGLLHAVSVAAAIENADQHAKNIGILYDPQARLAPLYDLTSTIVYPALSKRAAFVVGGELYIDQIDDEACVVAIVDAARMPETLARRMLDDLTARLHRAVENAVSDAHVEGWMSPVVEQIAELVVSWPQRARG